MTPVNGDRAHRTGDDMSAEGRATWRDPALGKAGELNLSGGKLRYFEAGAGTPIVFVHGLLVNANLWRKVVPKLSPDFRCITLDLPLGSHTLPMPDADLSVYGLADLIAGSIAELGLDDVALVGNDTGGALCQVVVTRSPEHIGHIGRLVLTSCEYREKAPPAIFSYLGPATRFPAVAPLLFAPMRLRAPRRLPFAFGWLAKRPIDREAEDSYVFPGMTNRGIVRDAHRVITGLDKRYLDEAADRLGSFERPVLIAWSREDRFFGPERAQGLASECPNARLQWIDDAYTFSMEDNPERVAELIAEFVREPVST
jgi:pimeloyl-ACP methyl ester carboxylesterase